MRNQKRSDVYQKITNDILGQMEKGDLPWSPRWKKGPLLLPIRATGEPYQGINVLNLWSAASKAYYASPRWLTFNQAKKEGGYVRKGQTGYSVVYWKTFAKEVEEESEEEATHRTLSIPLMRTYTVFNADQIEGLAPDPRAAELFQHNEARAPRVEAFVQASGAEVTNRGTQALYHPHIDEIRMPPFETFTDPNAYYSTLCHELIHWTGHSSRLNRLKSPFSEEDRAREELIAELGSAFLCAHLGIHSEPRADHAAYLAYWIDVLRNDKKAIFKAASAAQAAVSYLIKPADELAA